MRRPALTAAISRSQTSTRTRSFPASRASSRSGPRPGASRCAAARSWPCCSIRSAPNSSDRSGGSSSASFRSASARPNRAVIWRNRSKTVRSLTFKSGVLVWSRLCHGEPGVENLPRSAGDVETGTIANSPQGPTGPPEGRRNGRISARANAVCAVPYAIGAAVACASPPGEKTAAGRDLPAAMSLPSRRRRWAAATEAGFDFRTCRTPPSRCRRMHPSRHPRARRTSRLRPGIARRA